MLRWLYIRLLFLHPAPFRYRFCDEMLEIFDNTTGVRASLLLIGDGVISLLRQWAFRGEFREPAPAATDVPLFQTFEPYHPRPAALVHGGFFAMLALLGVVMAIGHAGKFRAFLIGAHRPGHGLLAVDRDSIAESELNTTVAVPSAPEDPLKPIATAYFRMMPVLTALDSDQDLVISPWEIVTAPAALRKLDIDRDGRLSPEECGFFVHGEADADVTIRARRAFMNINPVLAALDADHDGAISESEIAGASAALKKLDRNRDGYLTPDELLPDQAESQAAMLMVWFDRDDDGVLSPSELSTDKAAPVRQFLQTAGRDQDGGITREELIHRLRIINYNRRAADNARRIIGAPKPYAIGPAH